MLFQAVGWDCEEFRVDWKHMKMVRDRDGEKDRYGIEKLEVEIYHVWGWIERHYWQSQSLDSG